MAFRFIIINTAKGRSVRNSWEWCEKNPAWIPPLQQGRGWMPFRLRLSMLVSILVLEPVRRPDGTRSSFFQVRRCGAGWRISGFELRVSAVRHPAEIQASTTTNHFYPFRKESVILRSVKIDKVARSPDSVAPLLDFTIKLWVKKQSQHAIVKQSPFLMSEIVSPPTLFKSSFLSFRLPILTDFQSKSLIGKSKNKKNRKFF